MADGHYAIEFHQKGLFLFVYLRFWRGEQLCRVLLRRTGRVVGQTRAELSLLSSVLAAISTRPNLVCCNGGSFDLIQLIDNSVLLPKGVQSPMRFDDLCLAKLMHKQTYSVFGRIDFFSVLKY